MQRSSKKASTRRKSVKASAGRVLVGCLLLALSASPANAQRRVTTYKSQHRIARELAPLAQTALGEGGSVAVDDGTNTLLLIGDPGEVARALGLLASQDRAMRRVLLRYDTRRIRELARQGLEVRWGAKRGAVRLGSLLVPRGLDSSVRAQASEAVSRLIESLSGRMSVLEGETTRIETGTALPFSTQGPSGSSTQIVNATSGFEAKPRILADGRVELALAAFAGRVRLDGLIDSMGTSTVLHLEPGALVVVGSTNASARAHRVRTGAGTGHEQSRDEWVLLLRADVE
jgi:hypothetical protein